MAELSSSVASARFGLTLVAVVATAGGWLALTIGDAPAIPDAPSTAPTLSLDLPSNYLPAPPPPRPAPMAVTRSSR